MSRFEIVSKGIHVVSIDDEWEELAVVIQLQRET